MLEAPIDAAGANGSSEPAAPDAEAAPVAGPRVEPMFEGSQDEPIIRRERLPQREPVDGDNRELPRAEREDRRLRRSGLQAVRDEDHQWRAVRDPGPGFPVHADRQPALFRR